MPPFRGVKERSNPRFHWEQFQGNLELVAEMRRLTDEKQVAARQLALAARSGQMTSCRFRGGAVGEPGAECHSLCDHPLSRSPGADRGAHA
jgi:hypothetical protein